MGARAGARIVLRCPHAPISPLTTRLFEFGGRGDLSPRSNQREAEHTA
jgi:hypothetical protein